MTPLSPSPPPPPSPPLFFFSPPYFLHHLCEYITYVLLLMDEVVDEEVDAGGHLATSSVDEFVEVGRSGIVI